MEYIIKYTGDLPDLGFPTELLDAQFAIMDLGERDPMGLLEHRQVTCFEPARSLSGLEAVPGGPLDYKSMEAACIPQVRREYGLTGKGVLIGFVDSGLDLTHPEFLGEDGVSRVAALWDMTARGAPPEGFRQGALYSGEEIAAGRVPSGDRSGHGTAVAAVAAVCCTEAFDPVAIREAISTYQGTKRRFETWLKEDNGLGRVVIDDYAHHPEELRSSIASVKALYPGRRLTVAFQPHLYSRTRDFAPNFADALSGADELLLLPIYPAREEPIPGVTSEMIFKDVKTADKSLIAKEKLVETLKSRNFDILLTVGAGDINTLLPQIVENARQEH